MLLIALLLTLSLWQWRQRPAPAALPQECASGALHLRAGGVVYRYYFAIPGDAGHLWWLWGRAAVAGEFVDRNRGYTQELLQLPDLRRFIGLFFVHSTVGEVFFQRTVGKATLGLRVIAAGCWRKPVLGQCWCATS